MRVLTLSLFATILSAPAFAADLGTYRPGAPYHSVAAPGADVCDSQCSGDAQCRGWNYVKPNPRAPGICEFLSSVSAPIASQISISGVNAAAAPYSPRLTAGGTNTIRVGTQVSQNTNTTRVGQSPSGRRIIRQAPTQRIVPQTAATKPVENLSLTEQQNRYRQGIVSAPQVPSAAPRQFTGQVPTQSSARFPAQQRAPQAAAPQRPVFRQHLDAAYGQQPQQFQQPQPQQLQQQQFEQPQIQQPKAQQTRRQASRRVTGPRRAPAQPNVQNPAPNAPQFQDPRFQAPQPQGQPFPPQQFQAPQQGAPVPPSTAQQPALRRGSSRPPVGTPIPTAQAPVRQAPARPLRSTPSQRLAQFQSQTSAAPASAPASGPIALTPEQAQRSLFGRLNDDVRAPEDTPADMPIATSVPTQPVIQQELGDVLAGGL